MFYSHVNLGLEFFTRSVLVTMYRTFRCPIDKPDRVQLPYIAGGQRNRSRRLDYLHFIWLATRSGASNCPFVQQLSGTSTYIVLRASSLQPVSSPQLKAVHTEHATYPFLLCLTVSRSFFHFDYFTDGRTPWTSDQPVARPLSKHWTTQTQNKRIHIPNIHALCGIRTHYSGFRASTSLRPLGYRDRLILFLPQVLQQ
jgi:hypothetical protein